ncbi:MAG: electron transfer flavoprotein subunit alpha/FixB family protein [Dehalococcoidia bacterium]
MAEEDKRAAVGTGTSVPQENGSGSGIWFFAEHKDAKPAEASLKLAGEARNLADKLGQEVSAIIVGYKVRSVSSEFGHYGTDKALVVEDQHLETYDSEAYLDVLAQLAESNKPYIILFSATPLGNDLAPRLAARLKAGFAARYAEIDVGPEGRPIVRRAIHGGNAHATVTSLGKPLIATIDPQTLSLQKAKEPKNTQVMDPKVRISAKSSKTRVIDYLKADPCAVCVSEAEIVIGVGKGLGSVENLTAVEELARLLGASVGGSRRATDERWIADERRIGLTGKTISPELYLICGISGAFHHTLGIKGARLKVVVNTDARAPIAKMADLMVVGDMQQIVPELTQQLRQLIRPDS